MEKLSTDCVHDDSVNNIMLQNRIYKYLVRAHYKLSTLKY